MKTNIEIAQRKPNATIQVIALETQNFFSEEVSLMEKYKAKIDKNSVHNLENFGKLIQSHQ